MLTGNKILKSIDSRRAYFGLWFQKRSPKWQRRYGNRQPEHGSEISHLQPRRESMTVNKKWGETINFKAHLSDVLPSTSLYLLKVLYPPHQPVTECSMTYTCQEHFSFKPTHSTPWPPQAWEPYHKGEMRLVQLQKSSIISTLFKSPKC